MGCINSKSKTVAKKTTVAKDVTIETTNSPLTSQDIEMRIDCSKDIQTINLGSVAISYAWVSQRGYYPDGIIFNYGVYSSWNLILHMLLI